MVFIAFILGTGTALFGSLIAITRRVRTPIGELLRQR
jgi:hypothetical protein